MFLFRNVIQFIFFLELFVSLVTHLSSLQSLEYDDPRKLAVKAATCTKEQRQERGRSGPSSRPVNGIPNGGISPGGVNGSMGVSGPSVMGHQSSSEQNTTSGLSTPSTLSPGDGYSLEDEFNMVIVHSLENFDCFTSTTVCRNCHFLNFVFMSHNGSNLISLVRIIILWFICRHTSNWYSGLMGIRNLLLIRWC